jgi:hypothetical protein
MHPDRRTFVAGGVTTLAAATSGFRPARSATTPLPQELLAGLVQDLQAARWLGSIYLAQGGDPTPAYRVLAGATDAAAMRAAIRRQASHELAKDQIVLLDGWVVAPIEAQVLALLTVAEV